MRKVRWDDESYLARIIFSEMIKKSVLDETGYGIAPYEIEAGSPICTVNMRDKTVTDTEGKTYSFDDYIKKGGT